MKRTSNFPFRSWVPQWLGLLIFLFLLVPTFFVCGAYTSNASEMSGTLGIISEHIQYSSFATAVGMVVFTPFVVRFLILRRPKMSYLFCFSALFVLSLICAATDSMFLLMIGSFLMGMFRIILILNTIFSMAQYLLHTDVAVRYFPQMATMNVVHSYIPKLAPTDLKVIDAMDLVKALYMAFMYGFFLSLSQLCSSATAWFAHEYEWQYAYYAMSGLTLFALILVQVTMVYEKRKFRRSDIRFTRMGDLCAASLFLLAVCYVLIYGKTYDWFDNSTIRLATGVALFMLGFFVLIQVNVKTPYFRFSVFSRRYTGIAILVFLLLMLTNSHSALVSAYTAISMNIDNLQSAELNNYGLIGYAIGVVICIIVFLKKWSYRWLFASGFVFIGISAVYLYFYFQSEGLYADMKFPVIVRCIGMDMLYAGGAIYGMKRLPAIGFPSWVFIMLAFRSVLAPVGGSSLYSNLIYHRSQQHLSAMMEYADESNIDFAGSYRRYVSAGKYAGKSTEEAVQLAVTRLKESFQQQAMLVTLKEIAGWTFYACIFSFVLFLLIPYPK